MSVEEIVLERRRRKELRRQVRVRQYRKERITRTKLLITRCLRSLLCVQVGMRSLMQLIVRSCAHVFVGVSSELHPDLLDELVRSHGE